METADCFKTFPQLKDHLSSTKGGPGNNQNMNEHLSAIMDHIIIHCPDDSLNKLEEISYLIKHKDTHAIDEFLKTHQIPVYAKPADEITCENSQPSIDASKDFFKVSLFFIFILYFFLA